MRAPRMPPRWSRLREVANGREGCGPRGVAGAPDGVTAIVRGCYFASTRRADTMMTSSIGASW